MLSEILAYAADTADYTRTGYFNGSWCNGVIVTYNVAGQVADGVSHITIRVAGSQIPLCNRIDSHILRMISDCKGGQGIADTGFISIYIDLGTVNLRGKQSLEVILEGDATANAGTKCDVVRFRPGKSDPTAYSQHNDASFTVVGCKQAFIYVSGLQTNGDNVQYKCGIISEAVSGRTCNAGYMALGRSEDPTPDFGWFYDYVSNDYRQLPIDINSLIASAEFVILHNPIKSMLTN